MYVANAVGVISRQRTDQTARMHSLISAFVVRMQEKQTAFS